MMALRSDMALVAGDGQTRRWYNSAYVAAARPQVASGALSSKTASGPVTMSWSWDDSRDRDWALIAVPLRNAATTAGSVVSPPIDFEWVPGCPRWGKLTFSGDESVGDVACGIQYWDSAEWRDASITNRDASPVDISDLDPVAYDRIRLKATLSRELDKQ